jgi:hypothetical protein
LLPSTASGFLADCARPIANCKTDRKAGDKNGGFRKIAAKRSRNARSIEERSVCISLAIANMIFTDYFRPAG